MAQSEYMTMEEAAKELRVNIDTARRYVREGKLGSVRKIGKRYLIPAAAVRDFIEGSVYEPPRKPAAVAESDKEEPKKLKGAGD